VNANSLSAKNGIGFVCNGSFWELNVVPSSSSEVLSSSSSVPSSSSSIQCSDKGNGTFIDDRDDKTYRYVTICSQTWMAENLNYNASGSRCYGDNSGDDKEGYCSIYGRLYDWSTAVSLPSSCNSNLCASLI